jgi:hypothetical protein
VTSPAQSGLSGCKRNTAHFKKNNWEAFFLKNPQVLRSFICGCVFVMTAALFWTPLCEAAFIAEVLPIMTDGEVEDSENVWGILVYGNRLEPKAERTERLERANVSGGRRSFGLCGNLRRGKISGIGQD